MSRDTGASPFATAAKRGTTRVKKVKIKVENESIIATDDIYCVPNCSSQHRHLNQYKVQVHEYEHISCNVLANAWFNTSQPPVLTSSG